MGYWFEIDVICPICGQETLRMFWDFPLKHKKRFDKMKLYNIKCSNCEFDGMKEIIPRNNSFQNNFEQVYNFKWKEVICNTCKFKKVKSRWFPCKECDDWSKGERYTKWECDE